MFIPVGNSFVHESARYIGSIRHFIQMRFEGEDFSPMNFVNDVMRLPSFTSIAIYHPTLSLHGIDLVVGEQEDVVWIELKYGENIVKYFEHERI